MWRSVLTGPANGQEMHVFIAQNGNEPVGFGACGAQRDPTLGEQGFDGEIGALYVLQAKHGAGVGKQLMGLMAQSLQNRGRNAASLWVLGENVRARAFYERLGGTKVGEKVDDLSGVAVSEVAYGWRNLELLAH